MTGNARPLRHSETYLTGTFIIHLPETESSLSIQQNSYNQQYPLRLGTGCEFRKALTLDIKVLEAISCSTSKYRKSTCLTLGKSFFHYGFVFRQTKGRLRRLGSQPYDLDEWYTFYYTKHSIADFYYRRIYSYMVLNKRKGHKLAKKRAGYQRQEQQQQGFKQAGYSSDNYHIVYDDNYHIVYDENSHIVYDMTEAKQFKILIRKELTLRQSSSRDPTSQ